VAAGRARGLLNPRADDADASITTTRLSLTRRRRLIGLTSVATLVLIAGVGVHAASGAAPSGSDAKLGSALQQLVAMPGGPVGAVAVVQRGGIRRLFRAGVADRRTGRQIGLDDSMRIASVTKAFSGAAALALVAKGRLSLDDTIGGRLHGFSRAWAKVETSPHSRPSMRRLVSFVARRPLVFRPGSRFEYSNTDNLMIAFMVQAATRRPYPQSLTKLVMRPLALHDTSLPAGFRLPTPFLHGYVFPASRGEDVSTAASAAWISASGGVVSTPADLNRFIRGYVGARLFGRSVQRQQLRFVPGASEPIGPGQNSSGLGIFRYRTRCGTVYGHTGNFLGYTQFAASTPDGRRSVTVTADEQLNQDLTGQPLRVFQRLRAAELDAVCAALAR
jgi:D-alanyl-D-alanine carboxypeptidase